MRKLLVFHFTSSTSTIIINTILLFVAILFSLNFVDGNPSPSSLLNPEIQQQNIVSRPSSSLYELRTKKDKGVPSLPSSFLQQQPLQQQYHLPQSAASSSLDASSRQQQQEHSPTFLHSETDFQYEASSQQTPATIQRQPPRLLEKISCHFEGIRQKSPNVWMMSLACIVVHILWQIPICRGTLSRHFVVSRTNVWNRPQSLLLNSISHSSGWHLMMNLLIYLSIGPTLQQTLQHTHKTRNNKSRCWLFWSFIVGASVSGSCLHLWKEKINGCMGLSTITASMVAFQANIFPNDVEALLRYIIPPYGRSKVKASTIVNILLAVSALGCFHQNDNSRAAHAAHLGGLLFGIGYYQMWLWRSVFFPKRYQRHFCYSIHEDV